MLVLKHLVKPLLLTSLILLGHVGSRTSPAPAVDLSSTPGRSDCAFPESFVGTYRFQYSTPTFYADGMREPIKYKELFVGPTAIPLYGECYERLEDSRYVLGLRKVGGFVCFRCIGIIQRSVNALQLNLANEKQCFASVSEAQANCPDLNVLSVAVGDSKMLWRWDEAMRYEYCPLAGKAKLQYAMANAPFHCIVSESKANSTASSISNCNQGYQLDIQFRSCNFPDYDLSMLCLGSWSSGRENGENYFALYNVAADEYRCGIFKESADKRSAFAALASDSSCWSELFNSTRGAETFVLHRDYILAEGPATIQSKSCRFPQWMQKDWGSFVVTDDLISYAQRQNSTVKATIRGTCVGYEESKYRIFSRSQCGEPIGFHCLWMEKRSDSVLEFKMGNTILQEDNRLLCSDEAAYANASWTTLSARSNDRFVACPWPNAGAFVSTADDRRSSNFCFKFAADCRRNDSFAYSASVCGTDTVYERSEFLCLASWQENNFQFLYALKTDDNSRSCFISQFRNNRLYVIVTGQRCDRGVLSNATDLLFTSQREANTKSFVLEQKAGLCHQRPDDTSQKLTSETPAATATSARPSEAAKATIAGTALADFAAQQDLPKHSPLSESPSTVPTFVAAVFATRRFMPELKTSQVDSYVDSKYSIGSRTHEEPTNNSTMQETSQLLLQAILLLTFLRLLQ